MSIVKVPALVTCLMRLHNFCIDHDSRRTPSPRQADERAIQRSAGQMKGNPSAVTLGQHGAPEDLLGSGHHFRDEPGGRGRRPGVVQRERLTPMREMMKKVADLDLSRPTLRGVLD